MFEELEKILNYNFKNKELLKEALTHPSVSCNNSKTKRFNYERLEFLGDSILSMIINEYLFRKHKNETEGELSKRKAFLVSKNTLYKISKQMKFNDFIILSRGEEQCGGRENISNLENIVESIIGAIYLDSDFDTIKQFILNIWSKIDENEKKPPKDPKTELQEWTQGRYKVLPEYKLLNTTIVNNKKIFTISLTVPKYQSMELVGDNIKKVEENLANEMLQIIKHKK